MTLAHISPAPRELLRDAGLKVTAPRLAVLLAVEQAPHSDADALFAAVRRGLPGTSLQAVYGVLGALTTAGLVRRIEPATSPALYERRIGDNHHHVVCTSCKAVEDVDCVHGAAPCLTPSSSHGFVVEAAEVTFWGLCPRCQALPGAARAASAPTVR
ncbi:Fur family transcriptional regulator [Marisediminicola antarctica]|uniref:Transcriptional repressor n=1 Tax=Marisediminicola antarctica TaxID=674079 RepID=A0A7L5AFL1_9MICO|nr:Fur family transcriptional regulator [Marisediminicola antarctica]QHO68752.1 transcriptional repressor [Marisediminicola antarctica]